MAGPDEINLLDQTFAMTNPNVRPDSSKPVVRPDSDALRRIRKESIRAVTDDQTAGINKWPARVLRVENRSNANEGGTSPFDWFDSLITATGLGSDKEDKKSPVVITAITDSDVHSMAWGKLGVGFSLFEWPINGSPGSAGTIDLIRDGMKAVFRAETKEIPDPDVGDLVWVTWGDLANRKDGQYLGIIAKSPGVSTPDSRPIGSAGGGSSARSTADSDCCDELRSEPPSGLNGRAKNLSTKSEITSIRRRKKIDARRERGENPIGKGVFTGFPDIRTHKVKQARQATLSWVCYTGLRQGTDGLIKTADLNKAKKFSTTYHKKGIRTYLMGYPSYSYEESFISDLFTMAEKASVIGIIINLDHYYNTNDGLKFQPTAPYDRETFLMKTLKDFSLKTGFSIGLTATDIVNKKDTPWKIFSDSVHGVDFAIPQVLSQNFSSLRNNIIDNSLLQQQGPTAGQPTYFDDITPNNFKEYASRFKPPKGYNSIEEFKESWYKQGFKKKSGDLDVRTLYLMGAAEIITQYWRSITGFSSAKVKITSHIEYRANGKGNHKTGGAMDFCIEYGVNKTRVPVLQTWAALKKIQETARLPKGGIGLYLNLANGGNASILPVNAGKASKGGTPGGSANVHYDMRQFIYTNGAGKNKKWVNLDTTGNGSDDVKSSIYSTLKSRGRQDVADYTTAKGTWVVDGNYNNGFVPAVPGEVLNLKQLFGLESPPPPALATQAEDVFVTFFRPWKDLGFKHIIPGLGMVGKTPAPDGWKSDGYNTVEKSPWRMREDAVWTFTSVKDMLGDSMANSVIWWDWEGANTTARDWPEKRWDIIRELGDAIASASKVATIKAGNIDDKEKNKIITRQLGDYMHQNPSPAEEQQEAQLNPSARQTKTPESVTPAETKTHNVPEPTGLTAEQKKQKQEEIDQIVASLKEDKRSLDAHKTVLRSIETKDDEEAKKLLENKIAAKQKTIKEKEQKIQTLRAELSQDNVSGNEEPPSSQVNCPCPEDTGGGFVSEDGTALGRINETELPGVTPYEFGPDEGFPVFPLKGAGFIIIHNPGSSGSTPGSLVTHLIKGGLGVHFSVNRAGGVTQFLPLDKGTNHAPGVNYNSIGIEVLANSGPSGQASPAKDFVLGPPAMYEAAYQLVIKINRAAPSFKLIFPDYDKKKGLFYYGHSRKSRGVTAHASYVKQRTDGKIEVLYMALRRRHGFSPIKAYKICKDMHEIAKTSSFKYPSPNKQEDGQGNGWIRVPGVEVIEEVSTEDAADAGQIKPCPDGQYSTGLNPDGTPICEEDAP